MGKPVVGDVVVVPFPQTDLKVGKRRPALVVADLDGDDIILCQITSQSRGDSHSVSLDAGDFQQGQLTVASYARANRLFTLDQSIVIYIAARVTNAKLNVVKEKIRRLFA